MNASRALAAEQVIALTAGTARDLIAQGPNRGLPRPRFLLAVLAFYGFLGIVSAFGTQAARVAVAFGGVAALTTVVVGPGGGAIIGLFKNLSGLTTPGSSAAQPAPAGGVTLNIRPSSPVGPQGGVPAYIQP